MVISILDLIAYHAASYHATADDWLQYRSVLRATARRADGITTISEDVAATLQRERLPIEHDRVFPVLYGTEHLSGHEPAVFPQELADDGRLGGEFMVCVGTDYAHKNRDLAIAVHHELARRGRAMTLVLAGPSVPFGGSRNSERQQLRRDGDVVFLPAVTSRERNWLFKHAVGRAVPDVGRRVRPRALRSRTLRESHGDGRVRTPARDGGRCAGRRDLVGPP